METLNKIKESRGELEGKLKELAKKQASLQAQADALKKMRDTMKNSTPPE